MNLEATEEVSEPAYVPVWCSKRHCNSVGRGTHSEAGKVRCSNARKASGGAVTIWIVSGIYPSCGLTGH